jgi:hypothetical protein
LQARAGACVAAMWVYRGRGSGGVACVGCRWKLRAHGTGSRWFSWKGGAGSSGTPCTWQHSAAAPAGMRAWCGPRMGRYACVRPRSSRWQSDGTCAGSSVAAAQHAQQQQPPWPIGSSTASAHRDCCQRVLEGSGCNCGSLAHTMPTQQLQQCRNQRWQPTGGC